MLFLIAAVISEMSMYNLQLGIGFSMFNKRFKNKTESVSLVACGKEFHAFIVEGKKEFI